MDKSGFIIIKLGQHQVGLQDKNGKEILPCVYDKILDYDEDGYVRFIKDGVYGTVNLKGDICIPLSLGITHLGVFHKGTARARKGKCWGLVTTHGQTVGTFDFQTIDAFIYHLKAYRACDVNGNDGVLHPDGSFKPDKKKQDVPVCHATLSYSLYDLKHFEYLVKSFIGQYYPRLRFYYRDTDAEINVKKLYKKGRIIHNDRFLVADEKLLKPIHKTRFLILSTGFIPFSKYERVFLSDENVDDLENRDDAEGHRMNEDSRVFSRTNASEVSTENKGVVIPPNTYFIVKDVVSYAGVTQVLLLHIPYYAIEISENTGVKLSSFKAVTEDYVPIGKAALCDLQEKTGEMVYGHSLSADWCEKMAHPLGCDDHFCLNSLEPTPLTELTTEQQCLLHTWQVEKRDDSSTWDEKWLKNVQKNHVYLYTGDGSLMDADAIVWPADQDLPDSTTKFNRVIRTVVPHWKDNKGVEDELAACYQSALDTVITEKHGSIVIPLLGTNDYGFKLETAAHVAVKTIFDVLEKGNCDADIYVFCQNEVALQTVLKVANGIAF